FTDIILGRVTGPISHAECCPPIPSQQQPDLKAILTCPPSDKIRKMPVYQALVADLMSDFNSLYDRANPDKNFVIRRQLVFNQEDHAWPIAKNADIITNGCSLRGFLGSEAIHGIFKCILDCISRWERSYLYQLNAGDIETAAGLRITTATKKILRQTQSKSKRSAATAELD
ncbi:hypothetical protein DFH28DRAFT_831380, partial [Melampsora americana]